MSRQSIIIAEVGENHLGDWEIAARMIEEAAANGADIVKFQSYLPSQLPPNDPEFEWVERVALPDDKHIEFKRMAEDCGIHFMSSPFTPARARFLCEELGCKYIKIASGLITNFELLDVVNSNSATVQQVFMSTGMSTIDEVRVAVDHLAQIEYVTVMHCVTQYPVAPDQANLRCIETLAGAFPDNATGYSDHTVGILACLLSIALGATALEKHFTLSRYLPGTDHVCSMLPDELADLCRQVELVEQMLGDGKRLPNTQELAIRDIARTRFKDLLD